MKFLFVQHALTNNFTQGINNQVTENHEAQVSVNTRDTHTHTHTNKRGNEILFSINISLPFTMISGLDGAGQWLSLPGHQTSHQWSSSYGATLKP